MNESFKTYYQSEIGLIEIVRTEEALTSLNFMDDKPVEDFTVHPALRACVAQVDQYFRGTGQDFSLPLAPQGTDFQQRVWRELLKIPYGQTVSYLDIARAIGSEQAVRAVGAANGQNPISIIIPCHRVIGSDGKLTGYGGGLWRKEWLLNHERNYSVGRQLTFL